MSNWDRKQTWRYTTCSNCGSWHYNLWLKHHRGQCACGHVAPKAAKAGNASTSDLALQVITGLGLDAGLFARLHQTAQTKASPAARVAELANKLAIIEDQAEQARKKHQ